MNTVLVPQSWSEDLGNLVGVLGPNIQLNSSWSTELEVEGAVKGLCCESVDDLEALNVFDDIEVVSFTGTGISDVLEMPIVQGRSLTLCNIRDYASVDVAEHTIALVLALAKRLAEGEKLIQAGKWSSGGPWGQRLSGKTLGLVGLGPIGTEVARMARALGMNTVYWSRNSHAEVENQLGIRHVSLQQVFMMSDVVSIHLALNETTRGIVGDDLLRLMKRGSFLVNTARAGLIDSTALLQVLSENHLAGVGLDVFDEEPLPAGHELLSLPNVFLSPHVGAATPEAITRSREECLLNVVSYLMGEPRNVVRAGG